MDRRALALVAALTIVTGACTAGASPSPSPTVAPTAAPTAAPTPSPTPVPQAVKCTGQKVSFELSFIPNVQHAGFLVAAARGYYTDEGLTVDIKPAGPGVDVSADVADGTSDIGQVDYVEIVKARAAGVPIKSVAQTYKLPFFFWYSNKSANIATMADWKGKKVGAIQVGDYPERDAMLIKAGLDPKKDITLVQQDFGTDDFIAGKFDIAEGVVFYHPAFLVGVNHKNWPGDFNVYRPADLGADFASQTVAASESYLAANPAVIKCFLRASIRGWQATFADAQKAVDDVMTFIPPGAIPKPHQQAAINDVLPIVGSGATDPTLLQIDPAKYAATVASLVSLGIVTGTPDVGATYDTSYYDTMGPVPAP